MTLNYDGIKRGFFFVSNGIFDPLWSIFVEFQFYLIFPFLIIFIKQRNLFYIIWMIIFFAVIKILLSAIMKNDGFLFYTFFGHFNRFLIGMLIAFIALNSDSILSILKKYLFYTGFLGAFIAGYILLSGEMKSLHYEVESLFFGIFFIIYIHSRGKIPVGSFLLKHFARISYSVYVFHYFIIFTIRENYDLILKALHLQGFVSSPSISKGIFFILSFSVTVIVSMLSFYLIEEPFLRMKKH